MNDNLFSENERSKSMKSFTDIIFLEYPSDGETKSGLIKFYLKLNLEDNSLEYVDIGYSDNDIQSYVEKNPSVLTKIDSMRNKLTG